LIPGVLSTIASNLRKGSLDLAFFETGPVYNLLEGEDLPNESLRCAIALTGAPGGKHWSAPLQRADFYDLKGYLEALMTHLRLGWELAPVDSPTYHPRASAQIFVTGKPAGTMGETHPKVLEAYDIHQPVYLLELDLATLLAETVPPSLFVQPPTFPPSLRDLAFTVDKSLPAAELLQTVRAAGGRLLSKVSLFDLYTGKQVPEGKKSVALNLVFQAADRTLTDADTEKRYEKIIARLRKTHGAELR
jgi:phenylalanyl-tRNA synthetase beta chain